MANNVASIIKKAISCIFYIAKCGLDPVLDLNPERRNRNLNRKFFKVGTGTAINRSTTLFGSPDPDLN
jgi:hypothetical protein